LDELAAQVIDTKIKMLKLRAPLLRAEAEHNVLHKATRDVTSQREQSIF